MKPHNGFGLLAERCANFAGIELDVDNLPTKRVGSSAVCNQRSMNLLLPRFLVHLQRREINLADTAVRLRFDIRRNHNDKLNGVGIGTATYAEVKSSAIGVANAFDPALPNAAVRHATALQL